MIIVMVVRPDVMSLPAPRGRAGCLRPHIIHWWQQRTQQKSFNGCHCTGRLQGLKGARSFYNRGLKKP